MLGEFKGPTAGPMGAVDAVVLQADVVHAPPHAEVGAERGQLVGELSQRPVVRYLPYRDEPPCPANSV